MSFFPSFSSKERTLLQKNRYLIHLITFSNKFRYLFIQFCYIEETQHVLTFLCLWFYEFEKLVLRCTSQYSKPQACINHTVQCNHPKNRHTRFFKNKVFLVILQVKPFIKSVCSYNMTYRCRENTVLTILLLGQA